jgi:hypothetical protein
MIGAGALRRAAAEVRAPDASISNSARIVNDANVLKNTSEGAGITLSLAITCQKARLACVKSRSPSLLRPGRQDPWGCRLQLRAQASWSDATQTDFGAIRTRALSALSAAGAADRNASPASAVAACCMAAVISAAGAATSYPTARSANPPFNGRTRRPRPRATFPVIAFRSTRGTRSAGMVQKYVREPDAWTNGGLKGVWPGAGRVPFASASRHRGALTRYPAAIASPMIR